jgi:predicted nuclease of predicted toxin-antitoxin system
MRLKLDENLPARAVTWLRELGHDAEHVRDERLLGRPDEQVWSASQREQRVVVTTDLDVGAIATGSPEHFGVILLRPGDANRTVLNTMLRSVVTNPHLQDCAGRVVVAEDHRIRVRPRLSIVNPEEPSS